MPERMEGVHTNFRLTVSNTTDIQLNENWRLSSCFELFWVSPSQKPQGYFGRMATLSRVVQVKEEFPWRYLNDLLQNCSLNGLKQ